MFNWSFPSDSGEMTKLNDIFSQLSRRSRDKLDDYKVIELRYLLDVQDEEDVRKLLREDEHLKKYAFMAEYVDHNDDWENEVEYINYLLDADKIGSAEEYYDRLDALDQDDTYSTRKCCISVMLNNSGTNDIYLKEDSSKFNITPEEDAKYFVLFHKFCFNEEQFTSFLNEYFIGEDRSIFDKIFEAFKTKNLAVMVKYIGLVYTEVEVED